MRAARHGEAPWSAVANGIRVRVRLTPKSSRDAVEGLEQTADGPAIKVRVRAAPEKGEANAALAKALAKWLGVPKSRVELVGGAQSRLKTLLVSGNAAELSTRMVARLESV